LSLTPIRNCNNSLYYKSNIYHSKNNKIGKRYYSTNLSNKDHKDLNIEELKSLHHFYIKDLYKDRNAKVIPFTDKVLATCEDINNKSEFLNK